MLDLTRLETPCLILDRSRLQSNAARMTARYANTPIRLRPHMKTAKSIDVARIVLDGNFGGVTVSTLKEAEYFADQGCHDILYAVGIVPDKVARAASLAREGVRLSLITDSPEMIAEVGREAVANGVEFEVMIEIDSGERRAGLLPDSEVIATLGRTIHEQKGTRLIGVMTHAGNSYQGRSIAEIEAIAEAERLAVVNAARQLRDAGLPCPVVSVGSTPTSTHLKTFDGLTEMRCGVYMFGDVFQSEIASCALDDLAVSVLATVVGHRRDLNAALVDAGSLALSKDRSTGAPGLPRDIGFGLVCDAVTTAPIADVRVGQVYQEHGMLVSDGAFPFDLLPLGSKVRILPNHVCMTSAMYEGYHVVDGADTTVMGFWQRINGW